ncbi:MAG: NAD(P)-dependent oxidoreductase [Candidatus Thorarchaeota archaeon]|nr:NAD(P)-dependent oxidoreductase [Candidatus Thorarchaeota archaeon]
MKILITGAFGNIGECTVWQMLGRGYTLRCFDVKTKKNEKTRKRLAKYGEFETFWGDIRSYDAVREALEGVDIVVHLAAIIPPMSEVNPDLTWSVNVEGTTNVINAAKEIGIRKIIYTSSIATYGHSTGRGPPKTADDPQIAYDTYSKTKIEAEKRVRESGLPWTVFRLGAGPSPDYRWISRSTDTEIFMIPLEQKMEFVHPNDVGLAITNALEADTIGKILLIGGGERCRMTYRDFIAKTLESMGIGMLPESAFIVPQKEEDYFHTDFMDTSESQAFLQFQTRDLDDYLEDVKKQLGIKRYFIPVARWFIRRKMLATSPFYKR